MHFIVNSTTWYIFELYLERSEGVNQTFGFTIHWRKKKKIMTVIFSASCIH